MRLRFDRSQSEAEVELRFESSSAARWMPRAIAGGVIAVATVWALDITAVQRSGVMLRGLALAIGAYFALWALRTGSEVLTRVRLEGDRLWLDAPGRTRELRYAAIERVGWDGPCARSARQWLPAAVLFDEEGAAYRLPATLVDGETLVEEILQRAGREELRSWEEALAIKARMARPERVVAIGYTVAAAILIAATIELLR